MRAAYLHHKSGSTAKPYDSACDPRLGGAAVAAGLRAEHRANAGRRNGVIDLSARAGHSTGSHPVHSATALRSGPKQS